MALFKTTDDLKKMLPKAVGDILDSVLPFVDAAAEKYLKRYLGPEMLAELNDAYNDESTELSAELKDLLPYVQKPLAWFAMLLYSDQASVLISKNGMRIASTDEYKTAFKWQIEEVRQSYREMGYLAIETMLKFLDDNDQEEEYDTYLESETFKTNREHFIRYASDFENYYFIENSRNTYEVLRPLMREIENTLVKDTLGKDYYDELKTKLIGEDDAELDDDDKEILADLKSAIAKLTISQGIIANAIKITNLGVMVMSYEGATGETSTNQRPAPDTGKSTAYIQALRSGESFLQRVSDYLNKHASDDRFETYFGSDVYNDPDVDDEFFDNANDDAKIFVT